MSPRRSTLAAIAFLAASGCTSVTAPRREIPTVVLPAPPAPPRVKLLALLPDPADPRPRASWWKVILRLITGTDRDVAPLGALQRPFGVTLGPTGEVVVADPDAARVVRFLPGTPPHDLRCANHAWQAPIAVTAETAGELFVADAGAGVVVRWSDAGCTILGRGELERPTGVALVGDRIWVADPPRHRVLAFDRTGALLLKVGERGEGVGNFHYPSALSSTGDGEVAVVDSLNFRIVLLDAAGAWRSTFGSSGTTDSGLARPKGVAFDEQGRAWIADAQRDAILVFRRDGTFLFEFGTTGDAPGQFTHPAGLAVGNGRLVVADSQNHRVQVFATIGATP